MKKRIFSLILSLMMLLVVACSSKKDNSTPKMETKKEEVFKIGAIPDFDQSKLQDGMSDFARYLSEKTGLKVEFVPTVDYASLVTAFERGEIHMAWFGGLTAVQAMDKVSEAEVFAQRPSDEKFKTVFIQKKGLGLKGLKELNGKTFSFGSESSTSGHLMPRYFMTEAGINPDKDLNGKPNYSGSHDKTYKLVESGAFETGAVNMQYWEKAVKEKTIDLNKVEEFYRTPDFYDYNWTLNKDIDSKFGEGVKEKIKKTVLEMKKGDSKVMDLLSADSFIPSKNSNYDLIKKVAKQLGLVR